MTLLSLALVSTPARAWDFFEGRLQIHGYTEVQLRGIERDFESPQDWDLTQWWNVLDVEIEAELAPDGFGPFDLVSAFARLEGRYDCVWTRGCGMFSSANAYGDRAARLPKRLSDGRRSGFTGTQFTGDTRAYRGLPVAQLPSQFKFDGQGPRIASKFFDVPGFDALFQVKFLDPDTDATVFPADYYFADFLRGHCRYGFQGRKGSTNGVGINVLPHDPACKIRPLGALADRVNPFSASEPNPLTGITQVQELPYRPAPSRPTTAKFDPRVPQGVYVPNASLRRTLGDFDAFDQNFRQAELEWNRGASQQDEKELKEFYLDLEAFDGRLWMRAGKQSIVWGKTELFRTTDQFNPQDLAIASLPSLEESRISLWALRGVWSFYDVGPLEDVRLEAAFNFDQFEPVDLGRCGEPYAPLPVCFKTFGLQAHGMTGAGLAGEIRPPDPWNDLEGLEGGVRLEFRWSRFSFALTDFYGYNDAPYLDRVYTYSRNVDPLSGRPRRTESSAPCSTSASDPNLAEGEGCLGPDQDALLNQSANQQIFAMICGGSVGFASIDRTACANGILNSQLIVVPPTRVAALVSNLLAGNVRAHNIAQFQLTGGVRIPTVVLNQDPCDLLLADCLTEDPHFGDPNLSNAFRLPTLNRVLTVQQEALLGCGSFYQTDCEVDGIDLMNAEASVFVQAWPTFEGTFGTDWDIRDATRPQPGTVGFQGGPLCTRFERGRLQVLPGCRAPGDPGYDINVDGSTTGLVHPFTGQIFQNELAALSFNAMMALVALSLPDEGEPPDITEFDASRAFASGLCSFAQPQFCKGIAALIGIAPVTRNSVKAGGNGRFGRRTFLWASGGDVALRYDKRNVLGFSADFAEDVSKSNWSFEATFFDDALFADNDRADGLSRADTWNLTVSADRPTFVNFLNQNRTLFINSQWFFQYVDGFERGFTANGPWNTLGTLTVATGYFQDRMLPALTFVWDLKSNSGAVLPQIGYRFTENFSISFGLAFFAGRAEAKHAPVNDVLAVNRVGRGANSQFVDNGLSAVRERDEAWLRIKYTF